MSRVRSVHKDPALAFYGKISAFEFEQVQSCTDATSKE